MATNRPVPSAWVSLLRSYSARVDAVRVMFRPSNAGQWLDVPDGEVVIADVLGADDKPLPLDARDIAEAMYEKCGAYVDNHEDEPTHLFFCLAAFSVTDGKWDELGRCTQRGKIRRGGGSEDVDDGDEARNDKAARGDILVFLQRDRNQMSDKYFKLVDRVDAVLEGVMTWADKLSAREEKFAHREVEMEEARLEHEADMKRYEEAGQMGVALIQSMAPGINDWLKASAAEKAANAEATRKKKAKKKPKKKKEKKKPKKAKTIEAEVVP